jgi:hypothetical protein
MATEVRQTFTPSSKSKTGITGDNDVPFDAALYTNQTSANVGAILSAPTPLPTNDQSLAGCVSLSGRFRSRF